MPLKGCKAKTLAMQAQHAAKQSRAVDDLLDEEGDDYLLTDEEHDPDFECDSDMEMHTPGCFKLVPTPAPPLRRFKRDKYLRVPMDRKSFFQSVKLAPTQYGKRNA